ncbi:MAG: HD domain-containing protein [Candidatus Omnitrophica bacterium]|nr:HD domain-containing protein [Candidatus Omnitrophota bacterium]
MQKKKTSEKRLNKSTILWALFFEKLLQNVDACVVVTDSKGGAVFANRRHLDLFGLTRKKLMGSNWITGIIPQAARDQVREIFGTVKRNKAICKFDTPVVAKEDVKYFCWLALPLKEKSNFFYMFIGRECPAPPGGRVREHCLETDKLHSAYQEVVETLFAASKVSDPETAHHAARVMHIAVLLAKKLKLDMVSIGKLKVASLLHDLGKLAIDDRILFKNGKLSSDEFKEIKKHPHWGADVISLVYFLRDIIPIMANHHENYDGTGYPQGKKGDDIPIESRVLAVADIYEALTADRPYRKGYSRRKAIEIIKEEKGHKLDPAITDVFLKMAESNELEEEGF